MSRMYNTHILQMEKKEYNKMLLKIFVIFIKIFSIFRSFGQFKLMY